MACVSVNGLRLYYEIRGSGRPLVLLHGGLLTIGMTRRPGEVLALIAPFLDAC